MSTKDKTPVEEKTNTPAVVEPPKTGNALAVVDFGEDAGVGMENIDRSEYAIPFVRVLHALSPQVKPKSAGGLGCKAGDIFNLGTNEAFDGEKGVTFIPVHRDHNYVEFIPRNEDGSGGGFVGIRAVDDPLVLQLSAEQGKFGRLKTSEGTELTETFYLYGLLLDENNTPSQVVIGFSSTQIKKYKAFITRYMGIQYPNPQNVMVRPPLWAHKWKLTTAYEQKGVYNWYGWRVNLLEEPSSKSLMAITDPLYVLGREFYNVIKSGMIKANYAQAAEIDKPEDKEVPF